LIAAASAVCESFCGRKFESASRTEVQDGNGDPAIFLRAVPVTSITSITISDDFDNVDTYDSDDVRFDADTGRVTFRLSSTQDVFTAGKQNVSIVYVGGYATIPADVQSACIQIMRGLYASTADTNNPAMKSESIGDYSYTRRDDSSIDSIVLPGSARALLAPYRIFLFS